MLSGVVIGVYLSHIEAKYGERMMPRSLTEFLSLKLGACFETLTELTVLAQKPGGICDPTTLEQRYWQGHWWRPSLTPGVRQVRQLFCELTVLAPSLKALLSPPLDIELAKLLLQVASVKEYTLDNDPPKAFKKMSFDRRLKACLKVVRSYNLDAIDLHRKFPVPALALPQTVKSEDPEGDWIVGVSKEITVKSNPKGDWKLVVDRNNVPHLYVRRGLAYVVSYLT